MLRLRDFLARRGNPLQLETLTGDLGLVRPLPVSEIASPGLALAGFTDRFAPDRLHVFGETEITYLGTLSAADRLDNPQAHARTRGFTLSEDVAGYLLTHARRDMGSLMAAPDALDRYSLETGRAVTVPLLKQAMQGAG